MNPAQKILAICGNYDSVVYGRALSDLGKIPLLIRHDPKRVAGRILDLDYRPDGRLLLRARVDDPEAARMGGLSICATVLESEIRGEDSAFFHFVITKAIVGEISVAGTGNVARSK